MKGENGHINLLATIDRNYLSPLKVMLDSYIKTNKGRKTELYIAHSALNEEDFRQLREEFSSEELQIHNVCVKKKWFSEIPVLERLPEESFYRLLAFNILPKSITKCLYLDPDIIIRKSLAELYDMPLGNSYIAAAGHMTGFRDYFNRLRLGIRHRTRYLNSGIMLMNLEAIRRDFTTKKILSVLEENVQSLLLGDQDMVNILFGESATVLEEDVYNLDERTFSLRKKHSGWTLNTVADKTAIIHYNGKCKPWLMGYEGELDVFYPKTENPGPSPRNVARNHIKSFLNITRPTKQQLIVVICGAIFAAICIALWLVFGKEIAGIVSDPKAFRQYISRFGASDELIFLLLRAAQTAIKFIPSEALEIASGFMWGAFGGMLICVAGNLIGMLVILMLTERFGKKITSLFVPAKYINRISDFGYNRGIYMLAAVLNLFPGFPKDAFVYIAGLFPINKPLFLLIATAARMPAVLLSTFCGASIATKEYGVTVWLVIMLVIGVAIFPSIFKRVIKKKKGCENECKVNIKTKF